MATLWRCVAMQQKLSYLCRSLSTSTVLHKNRRIAARKPTVGQTDKLTYEQSQLPYQIGVTKSWNSWNTSNLEGESGASAAAYEDVFIRKFMHGTWLRLLESEIIIKRRHNMIFIAALINRRNNGYKLYFLIGYTEELLSHLLQRPVKLELQSLRDMDEKTFKYI